MQPKVLNTVTISIVLYEYSYQMPVLKCDDEALSSSNVTMLKSIEELGLRQLRPLNKTKYNFLIEMKGP